MSLSNVSGGTSTSPALVVNGLISGLNTQEIIQALLESYMAPETDLKDQQSTINSEVSDYQTINKDLQTLQTAANALSLPATNAQSAWASMQATSSNTSVATASAAQGAQAGQVSFDVTQLAQANILQSAGVVSSSSDVVTSLPDFLLSQAMPIGFSSLTASSGLALGTHTIEVTQASQAATDTGTTAFSQSASITIGSSNNTVDVTADGTAYTLTIASGTYTPAQLVSAIDSAASSAGAPVAAALTNTDSGYLVLGTTNQGSTASIEVTGGTALSTLGLPTQSSLVNGVDGVVSVDGYSQSFSNLSAGGTLTLYAGSSTGPTITATVAASSNGPASSLLQSGSITATNVSTGSGSLADVVANINAASAGVTASAIENSSGNYLLQLTSANTGVNGDLTVDTQAFNSSALGDLSTVQAGQDAEVTLAGGQSLSSQSNSFTDLLPGLTVTAVGTGSATVTVSPDAQAAASAVQALVNDANTVLSDISKYASYDQTTNTAGPLFGSAVLTSIRNQVLSIFAGDGPSGLGTSNLAGTLAVGITVNSNGTLSFNQSAFESAFQSNPSQVEAMFTQGGSFSVASSSTPYDGQVSLSYASQTTQAGSYTVDITQSATQAQATSTKVTSSSTLAGAETFSFNQGGVVASYSASAGESGQEIANGLNQAFASSGINLQAGFNSSGYLTVTASVYGGPGDFTVSTSGTTGQTGLSGSYSGLNVAGTIDGVTATGVGQVLSAPADNPTLAGLSLLVTGTGTGTGTYTYAPGIAQQMSSAAYDASNPINGTVTTTIQNLQTQSSDLNPQISFYASLVAQEKKLLEQEFAQLEATLGSLKNQGAMLSASIAQLP
ncbi:MAG: flagellar filament capping protein FliD [Actinobacteria bacterium]|nr:flagellar filament capping protein FliD [Actinomycetota bacterium]MCL6094604.1 flagellar filament capping protein FliD [Actinomycetota bacterium]